MINLRLEQLYVRGPPPPYFIVGTALLTADSALSVSDCIHMVSMAKEHLIVALCTVREGDVLPIKEFFLHVTF